MGWGTFDTPKPFGEVMREFNRNANESITVVNETNQPQVIIGLDQGSPDGDKAIVSIVQNGKYHLIGESVTLSIPNGWKNTEVKAIQVGDLAVHDAIEGHEDSWQVTHVPTVTEFDNAVPEAQCTQEQLLMWCWKVQQEKKDAWSILAKYDNNNYKVIPPNVLNEIKQWCLSVSL